MIKLFVLTIIIMTVVTVTTVIRGIAVITTLNKPTGAVSLSYTPTVLDVAPNTVSLVLNTCDKAHNEDNGDSEIECGRVQELYHLEYVCSGGICYVLPEGLTQ